MSVREPGQIQPGLTTASSGPSRVRNAIAKVYFHSPMPDWARSLRDQYHLNISSAGKWPKMSFEKRTEPTARILYYHRVNDDNDPFFPATPTALFEEEMRFISRYYRVVSLTELVNGLRGGSSTQPVLAITFDDGYKDNYLNAFPILQRYGLPASIFLTTGSIDSREPLWFEQLASALKKPTREFVDLEIDGTQRFWIRTEEERLASNLDIFGLLRKLPDSSRCTALQHILGELGHEHDRERWDKMLTWDEIRFMQKRGIEFGGHTVTHPFLSRMQRDQVFWEISECKKRIEEELQSSVDYFAYPNGREEDFGAWNKEVIRSAGYKAAVTTIWGMNFSSTDPMELRRGGPWEDTPAQFAYKLDWYQLVNG